MKKKLLTILVVALVVAVCGGAAYILIYQSAHIKVNDVYYPRSAKSLDLRDVRLTVGQYDELRREMPECEILWRIPFQGDYYEEDAAEITVDSLSGEDVALLGYFTKLSRIDARDCRDYGGIIAAMELYPECDIAYSVEIGDDSYPGDTTQMTVDSPDVGELAEKLRYLPELTAVHISNPAAGWEELEALAGQYPSTTVTWSVTIGGTELLMDVTEADISGVAPISVEEVESAVECLPKLEKLIMCDCGIDNEKMAEFRERAKPDYKVVWSVSCGSMTVRTDETTFMPAKDGIIYMWDKDLYNLRYCEDMVCIDVGHFRIKNIEWAAYMPHLKYLVLAHSWVREISPISGCKELIFLEMSDTVISDYEPLLGCTGLEDLNIGKTYGDKNIIAKMTWLKNLWWIGSSPAIVPMLKEALPDTKIQTYGERTVDGGWRKLKNYYDMRDMLGIFYMS